MHAIVEVHYSRFQAPYSKSPISHPKLEFGGQHTACPKYTAKNTATHKMKFRRLWFKEHPRHSENVLAKTHCSYRSTRHCFSIVERIGGNDILPRVVARATSTTPLNYCSDKTAPFVVLGRATLHKMVGSLEVSPLARSHRYILRRFGLNTGMCLAS